MNISTPRGKSWSQVIMASGSLAATTGLVIPAGRKVLSVWNDGDLRLRYNDGGTWRELEGMQDVAYAASVASLRAAPHIISNGGNLQIYNTDIGAADYKYIYEVYE